LPVPSKVERILVDAAKVVESDPQHDLPLGYRKAIWDAIGPRDDRDDEMSNAHRSRGRLAIEGARKVLGIWQREFPDDDTAQRALSDAIDVLQGRLDSDTAEEHYTEYWQHVDQLGFDSKSMAVSAGYAAVTALMTAVDDETYRPEQIDLNEQDSRDIDDNDASFFAAAAFASGPSWKTIGSDSDAEARRQFWLWWLNEAVPAACGS
jgi:hypothetical protein